VIGAYYERLGVSPSASADEIRAAYRNLARRYHPDSATTADPTRMASINEAWATLSDPGRRAMYDAALRGGDDRGRQVASSSGATMGSSAEARHNPFARYQDPPRFPWRFVVILVGVAIVLILGLGALAGDPADAPIDNLLAIGSCVEVDEVRGEVAEVPCDSPHDAVVDRLIPFDSVCPFGTEPFRDRQGMGLACIVRAG